MSLTPLSHSQAIQVRSGCVWVCLGTLKDVEGVAGTGKQLMEQVGLLAVVLS
jgi:hypothetical protein